MKKLQKLNGKKLSKKEQQAIHGGYIEPECELDDVLKEQCEAELGHWVTVSPAWCGYCVK